jgi:tetratricopeptide (TPR) repeat protein
MMRRLWMPLVLAGLALGLYARGWDYPFTNWDDQTYILHNPFLSQFSVANLTAILRGEMGVSEMLYIPLTYLSLMLDGAATGMNPARFHFTNTLLHAANTLLVFALLRYCRLSARASFVGAMIFCIHPLQVESVAWIMGRKDLLSTLLACLSMLLYLRSARGLFWWLWSASLLLFGLAVFAKPTVIVLPALLLGIDVLAGSAQRKRLFATLPFWAVSALGWGLSESGPGGTEGLRFLGTVIADVTRRIALLDPVNTYYTVRMTALADPNSLPTCAALGAILLTVVVCVWHRCWRAVIVLLMIAVTMLPVVSIAATLSRDFITADRYTYLPLIFVGLLIGLAVDAMSRHQCLRLALVAWCAYASALAWQQVPVWSSSEKLWRQALEYDSRNAIACNSLGNHFASVGERAEAARWYENAMSMNPQYKFPHYNLGLLELAADRPGIAVAHFETALKIDPAFRDARYNLAVAHIQREDWQPATRAVRAILEHPDTARDADAWYLYGQIHYLQGDSDTAFEAFRNSIAVNDGHAPAYFRIGMIQQARSNLGAALAAFERVVEVNPAHATAHYNAAVILQQQQQLHAALQHLRKAAALQPDDADIRKELESLEKHLAPTLKEGE